MASILGWGSRSREMDAFQDMVERFDRLLGSCDREMIAFTECLNNSQGGGRRVGGGGTEGGAAACAPAQEAMYQCQAGREAMHGRVMSACGPLYQSYEICMRSNTANPGVCMGELVTLYQCAKGA